MSDSTIIDPWMDDQKLEITQVYECAKTLSSDGDRIEITLVNDHPQSIDGEPAYTRYFGDSDKISVKVWCDQGLKHRENNWAVIAYFENGNLAFRSRHQKGTPHNYGFRFASEIYHRESGNLIEAESVENGISFSLSGPVEMCIDPDSRIVTYESWNTLFGFTGTHRDDGEAAYIDRNPVTGFPELKLWVQQDQLFRADGKPPVEIWDGHSNTLIESAFEHDCFPKKENISLPFLPI